MQRRCSSIELCISRLSVKLFLTSSAYTYSFSVSSHLSLTTILKIHLYGKEAASGAFVEAA